MPSAWGFYFWGHANSFWNYLLVWMVLDMDNGVSMFSSDKKRGANIPS